MDQLKYKCTKLNTMAHSKVQLRRWKRARTEQVNLWPPLWSTTIGNINPLSLSRLLPFLFSVDSLLLRPVESIVLSPSHLHDVFLTFDSVCRNPSFPSPNFLAGTMCSARRWSGLCSTLTWNWRTVSRVATTSSMSSLMSGCLVPFPICLRNVTNANVWIQSVVHSYTQGDFLQFKP